MDILNYTFAVVLAGTVIMGLISGSIGSFAYLRRQSLIGDAISHATLPGIVAVFLLTGQRSLPVLLFGAAAAGITAMILVSEFTHRSKLKMDTALGIVLSVFFGAGVVLLTFVNNLPVAGKAGLDRFIFGQAAIMQLADVVTITVIGGIILLIMLLFWKEFKMISFDSNFARSQGYPVRGIDHLLNLSIVLAILIGLQSVGVILMSVMIAVPAASARQWTQQLVPMVIVSGLFGGLSAAGGVIVSSSFSAMPTGPVIVLCSGLIFIVSIVLSPTRGLLFKWIRMREHRRAINCSYAPKEVYDY